MDGVNIATISSQPISVNTINPNANGFFYRNNMATTNGYPNMRANIRFDGLTTVITAKSLGLGPGIHTMKFAVADASDGILDAGVFLQKATFSTVNPEVPEPHNFVLMAAGLLVLGLLRQGIINRHRQS